MRPPGVTCHTGAVPVSTRRVLPDHERVPDRGRDRDHARARRHAARPDHERGHERVGRAAASCSSASTATRARCRPCCTRSGSSSTSCRRLRRPRTSSPRRPTTSSRASRGRRASEVCRSCTRTPSPTRSARRSASSRPATTSSSPASSRPAWHPTRSRSRSSTSAARTAARSSSRRTGLYRTDLMRPTKTSITLVLAILAGLPAVVLPGSAPAKGGWPTALAETGGSVWVADGNGRLIRVTPGGGRATVAAKAGNFAHAIAVSGRVLWVASSSGLYRVQPQTGSAVHVGPATAMTSVVVARGSIWTGVPEYDAVLRLDPRTGRVLATIRVPGRLTVIAGGAAGVFSEWVPTRGAFTGPRGTRLISRIDPLNNRLVGPRLRLSCDAKMAVDGSRLWVDDVCSNRVAAFDARTGKQLTRWVSVNGEPRALVAGFGDAWVATYSGVTRIAGESGRIAAQIELRSPILMTTSSRAVRVLSSQPARLHLIDPKTNVRQSLTIDLPK